MWRGCLSIAGDAFRLSIQPFLIQCIQRLLCQRWPVSFHFWSG